jgi:hypothetical protein
VVFRAPAEESQSHSRVKVNQPWSVGEQSTPEALSQGSEKILSLNLILPRPWEVIPKVRDGEDAIASTRDARATPVKS